MQLYLLRHGRAASQSRWQGDDLDRPLTAEGMSAMRDIGRAMRTLGLRFDAVWSSPYVRALETARAVTESQEGNASIEVVESLVVYGDGAAVVSRLGKRADVRSVLMVAHEPILGDLLSMLVAGSLDCEFRIGTGALAKLTIDELRWGRCASLDWILQPTHLLEIAAGERESNGAS